jgi:pyruvate/2-oxoglutarate dehydrogenase complex dihydrolipoamide acyltransferase (E2) component
MATKVHSTAAVGAVSRVDKFGKPMRIPTEVKARAVAQRPWRMASHVIVALTGAALLASCGIAPEFTPLPAAQASPTAMAPFGEAPVTPPATAKPAAPAKPKARPTAKPWRPIYDASIDPAAPPHALWTLVNPRRQDCAKLAAMVAAGQLAPEAAYDPAAPCVKLGYLKA